MQAHCIVSTQDAELILLLLTATFTVDEVYLPLHAMSVRKTVCIFVRFEARSDSARIAFLVFMKYLSIYLSSLHVSVSPSLQLHSISILSFSWTKYFFARYSQFHPPLSVLLHLSLYHALLYR